MTWCVAEPKSYRFEIDPDLKEKVDEAFAAQRTNLKQGTTSLLEFFLRVPVDLRPLILGQIRGRAASLLLRDLLNRMTDDDAFDEVVEHDDTPEDPPKGGHGRRANR